MELRAKTYWPIKLRGEIRTKSSDDHAFLDIHFGTDFHIHRERVNLQILIPYIQTSPTAFFLKTSYDVYQ